MSDLQKKIAWITGGFLILLKAMFLIVYGPLHLPDSGGYTVFADLMLSKSDWLHSLDLKTNYWQDLTAFRSIGYPAFIALTKIISGPSYDWLAVIFQISLSLVTSYFIFRLAHMLTERFWVGMFCALAHALSQGMLMDQCILTDSINTSLLLILACSIGMGFLRNETPLTRKLIGLGLLMALAFLVREAGNQLQFLYWPVVAYWIVQTTTSWKQRSVLFVSFLLPMLLFTQVYKGWNEYRSGERFITTAGQTTMFLPAIEIKKKGINVFENDEYLKDMPPYREPLDQVFPILNIQIINKHLAETHGLNGADISRYGFKSYFKNWFNYPLLMLQYTLSEIREKQAFVTFMPFETMMKIDFWATGYKPFDKKRNLFKKVKDESRYDLLAAYIGRHISRIISVVLTITFVFGVPITLIQHWKGRAYKVSQVDPKYILIFMYWLIYFGYTSAYAMVHLEQRYLLPVVSLSVVAAMFVLAEPLERLWAKVHSLINRGSSTHGG
ncbi:MAG: hypothetical protein OQJ97_18715 [Rhodospirillales bacterium]|nr:hypothetical protein [Rhodospirillales bacterium]